MLKNDYLNQGYHYGLIKLSSIKAIKDKGSCPIIATGLGVGCTKPINGVSHLYRVPDGKGLKELIKSKTLRVRFFLDGKVIYETSIKEDRPNQPIMTIIREDALGCIVLTSLKDDPSFDITSILKEKEKSDDDKFLLVEPFYLTVKRLESQTPPTHFASSVWEDTKKIINCFPGSVLDLTIDLSRIYSRKEIAETPMRKHLSLDSRMGILSL